MAEKETSTNKAMPKQDPNSTQDAAAAEAAAENSQDEEQWEDEDEEEIDKEDILQLAGQTNNLFLALMIDPRFNKADPIASPKPLFFAADFVRRTYLEYILPLLPADAPYQAREVGNPFLFDYTPERPLPTEPNPGFLMNLGTWPALLNDELFLDAVGRNTLVCLGLLEAHKPGSKGSLMLGGTYDFSGHVKEVAAMIIGGIEAEEKVKQRILAGDDIETRNAYLGLT